MDEERQPIGQVSTSNSPAVEDEYVETVDGDWLPTGEACRLCTRYKSLCHLALALSFCLSCAVHPNADQVMCCYMHCSTAAVLFCPGCGLPMPGYSGHT